MNEDNIYKNQFILTNKSLIEKESIPLEEEKQKKDINLLYQVIGQNYKLSNLKKNIGIFLEITNYIFNDIKSISETGKNVKTLQYNSKLKINNESLYNNKVKCFNSNLNLFKKKLNFIKEKNNDFNNIYGYIQNLKHYGFCLDENFDINENDMILDINKFIIQHKWVKNFEELIDIKNKYFQINNIENNKYKLYSDFYNYFNNKYILDFKLEIKIKVNNHFLSISNEYFDNCIKDNIDIYYENINKHDLLNRLDNENKYLLQFYVKYLLYKFYKEEINSFRKYFKNESKDMEFLNKGLNFNIKKYINNIYLKCFYFDNIEITFSISKIDKKEYKSNDKKDHLQKIKNEKTIKKAIRFINNILYDIKISKNITDFIGEVKKNNNLTLDNIIKNSIFMKNMSTMGLFLLKNEICNYILTKNNFITTYYLNILETPLGKFKILYDYYNNGIKSYYVIELVFDQDLNLTIILKEPYKNLIFNLDQGQLMYIEKGRINFIYLYDILNGIVKNLNISKNMKYSPKNSIL